MKSLRFRGFTPVLFLSLWLSLSFLTLSFFAHSANGEESNEENSHQEISYKESSHKKHKHHTKHSRVGFHGMVLVTDGSELYASHLPLYAKPHDYQLVYLLDSANKAQLLERLAVTKKDKTPLYQQNMVTLLPAKFDLNRLISGESFEIDTQFFSGHFERGGDKWFHEENLKFVRQVYKRPMTNLPAKTNSNAVNWHTIKVPGSESQLFIFPIQAAPSFDAIVLATSCSDKKATLPALPEGFPDFKQLKKTFCACTSSQVLYFETQDFAR